MRTPPPRSPELEALLAPHRTVVPLAPAVEARAMARARVAWTPQSTGRLSARPRWVFAAAAGAVLALGAAAYAAHAWIDPGSSGTTEGLVEPIAPPRVSGPRPLVVSTAPPAAIAPPAAPHVRRAAAKTTTAAVLPTNAELELLRAARQDVTHGDFAGALRVIAEHTHRFRHGGLVEEREALRVKSLIGLGRREEARRAAAAFHARFPHSVFLPTFERLNEADR